MSVHAELEIHHVTVSLGDLIAQVPVLEFDVFHFPAKFLIEFLQMGIGGGSRRDNRWD